MNELLALIRALVNEAAGFTTAHPTLANHLPADIGHAARVLIKEGILVKWRSGDGRVRFRGAHLPKPRRKDLGLSRATGLPKPPRVPRTTSGERIVDIARRLGKNARGFRTNDPAFAGIAPSTVGCSLQHMTARGELFKVRVTNKLVLFFGSPDDAQASVEHFRGKPVSTKPSLVVTSVAPHHRVDADAPADLSRARVTVCPGFVPRNVALDVLAPLLRPAPYRRAA